MQAKYVSKEVAPGEYGDLFELLMNELKLFKRKFVLMLKHVETGESQIHGLRHYTREHQARLLELVAADDFEGVLALPTGPVGECATQMECRYVPSGQLVGVQVNEARPHEGGRYVGLSPAKVFVGEDGKKLVAFAQAFCRK